MNNILFFSDLHITQSSLKECILILEEIGNLVTKYNVDTLIDLGDTFDSLKPNSAELDVFATFIRRLNKKIIIIAANSHESETEEKSILNHYGILSDNVKVVKEFKDANHLLCLHETIKESSKNFGAKRSIIDFKEFIYVFSGHDHHYHVIKPNWCHLGSCRWINFDEAKDKHKVVALITDYNGEKEEVHFLGLKSPIPMIELELGQNNQKTLILDPQNKTPDLKSSISEGGSASNPRQNQTISDLITQLDKTDPNTKIKVKILDFESFRQFLPLCSKYNTKFETFKYETDFTVISDNTQKCRLTEMTNFKESFTNYLKNQKIDEKVKEILEGEIK